MTRKPAPEFHKLMLDPATYPTATRKPKHEETRFSHLYKTGNEVFKIRKTGPTYANLAIKEVYAQEALQLGKRWSPTATLGMVAITQQGGALALSGNGAPMEFALRNVQLSDHYFVDYLAEHEKLNATTVGRVARFLALKHSEGPATEAETADIGRPEHIAGLLEDVLYQTKKYFGLGLTPAMHEFISRPVAHFLEQQRKLILRRQKKNRVAHVHGAFSPEHVYAKQQDVEAISPLEAPRNLRVLDVASDVAQFVNGLQLLGLAEEGQIFAQRYATAAKDRDLEAILPIYQVYQAARAGLLCCEWAGELPEGDEPRLEITQRALKRFELAVEIARTLPK